MSMNDSKRFESFLCLCSLDLNDTKDDFEVMKLKPKRRSVIICRYARNAVIVVAFSGWRQLPEQNQQKKINARGIFRLLSSEMTQSSQKRRELVYASLFFFDTMKNAYFKKVFNVINSSSDARFELPDFPSEYLCINSVLRGVVTNFPGSRHCPG